MNENLCDYCGAIAIHQFKNGKYCCATSTNSCPAIKKKNSVLYKSGQDNPAYGKSSWNSGLTKEDDKRIKQYGEKQREYWKHNKRPDNWNKGLTKETDIRIAQASEKMRITKTGQPNYKLRKSLSTRLRKIKAFRKQFKRDLYIHWIYPILERDNFKCTECYSYKELEVHHLKTYLSLFNETIRDLNLEFQEWKDWDIDILNKINNLLLQKHTLDIGITICKTCHEIIDPTRKRLSKKNV